MAAAQATPPVPSSATEPEGILAEPNPITRATLFADRHLGKGDLTNGIYWDFGNMIPGAGWLSIGPGYRQWYGKDSMFVDASAAVSVRGYKMGQARVELPALLKSRIGIGAQARWQDFGQVDFFGIGPATTEDVRSKYRIDSTQLTAFATLRPFRWMDIGAQAGWMNPRVRHADGNLLFGLDEQRTIVPTALSMMIDTRDFPGHPTSGVMLRGAGTRYDDRTSGANTFQRYEGEAAGFVPMFGSRVVLALRGWMIRSDVDSGRSVPFYLQPSLGGTTTLRSYSDYRFHDNNMAVANAELRVALMTHLDFAIFTDAGNVAARARDLDFDKRSHGVGLRLHTRRMTYATVDAARGDEGWRFAFRLTDPLALARLSKKATLVPFVP
jgi:hypothetical protein